MRRNREGLLRSRPRTDRNRGAGSRWQVIGSAQGIHISFFALGDTLASRIANQYQGALTHLAVSSLVYLALILLVFTLVVNVSAQVIVKRFEARHGH